MLRGKKAALSGILSDVWGLIIFVLAIIIFAVFFKISATNAQKISIEGKGLDTTADITLLNLLRTQADVTIAGTEKKMTVADIIIEYHMDPKFITGDFQKFMEEIIRSNVIQNTKNVGLRIIVSRKNDIENKNGVVVGVDPDANMDKDYKGPTMVATISRSCLALPNAQNPDQPIKIDLILVNSDKHNSDTSIRGQFKSSKFKSISC